MSDKTLGRLIGDAMLRQGWPRDPYDAALDVIAALRAEGYIITKVRREPGLAFYPADPEQREEG